MMIHVPTIPTGTKKKLCCQLYVFGNAIMMIKNDKIWKKNNCVTLIYVSKLRKLSP